MSWVHADDPVTVVFPQLLLTVCGIYLAGAYCPRMVPWIFLPPSHLFLLPEAFAPPSPPFAALWYHPSVVSVDPGNMNRSGSCRTGGGWTEHLSEMSHTWRYLSSWLLIDHWNYFPQSHWVPDQCFEHPVMLCYSKHSSVWGEALACRFSCSQCRHYTFVFLALRSQVSTLKISRWCVTPLIWAQLTYWVVWICCHCHHPTPETTLWTTPGFFVSSVSP